MIIPKKIANKPLEMHVKRYIFYKHSTIIYYYLHKSDTCIQLVVMVILHWKQAIAVITKNKIYSE